MPTTVNCVSHIAQSSKFPTGGKAGALRGLEARALYVSSSLSSSSSLIFTPFFFAAALALALACAVAFLPTFFFLRAGSSSSSDSSRKSESLPLARFAFYEKLNYRATSSA